MSQDTLDRARAGDEHAFGELVEPYRRELQVHCYRILGSLTDAEDMLQETLLAAWRGLGGYAGRASVRTWLYRIATNRCLNALRDAGRRIPAEPSPPFTPTEPSRRTEVTWLQPAPDAMLEHLSDHEPGPAARYGAKESLELAFVAALQHLPPRQAAVLVLRDVLGYSTTETADLLDTSAIAVKGALQRARTQLRQSYEPAPPAPEEREVAQRFADAFSEGDVERVVALLTDDGWLAMPPAPHEYTGPAVAEFLTMFGEWRGPRRFRLLPTRANTHPAFGCYLTESAGTVAYPAGILVLTLRGNRIRTVTWFLDPTLVTRFGLPGQVPC
ncbi:sigma-70 family RNA polymerase sigma factor [Amycolatopsis jejuensis]|uniref:sigma-70 family RNA polymerase sigma factor n=1 Tax=Amycolatopsis jejuensis TaxID=330084 RepID=UPI000525C434|nr:sigma-70 family RNA polymerase sigma factor [Amycolatopsis jejuensis]